MVSMRRPLCTCLAVFVAVCVCVCSSLVVNSETVVIPYMVINRQFDTLYITITGSLSANYSWVRYSLGLPNHPIFDVWNGLEIRPSNIESLHSVKYLVTEYTPISIFDPNNRRTVTMRLSIIVCKGNESSVYYHILYNHKVTVRQVYASEEVYHLL